MISLKKMLYMRRINNNKRDLLKAVFCVLIGGVIMGCSRKPSKTIVCWGDSLKSQLLLKTR